MVTIFIIFISSLLPQNKGIYKTFTRPSAQFILYSDSTFVYRERKPKKIIDRGIWTIKSDSIAIRSNEITKEIGRRLFDGNAFRAGDKEILILHPKYKIYMIFNEARSIR
jgi:hypothetical protein